MEKWKVMISLFIGLNALFTGFVLYEQNVIHKEDIINKVSDKYDQLSDSLYSIPLDYILKTPSLKYLINDMFMNETKKTDETEELEREIFDMLQKIKRHNKKKIYNTTKDLYKLFKRDKKL
jgi:hypothetical protein